jgi:hypothetical protein
MQQPEVPRILQEANAHPELRHLDLSLANIEIGEEELMVDPETPWWRTLWVRAFAFQLKLSVPAYRYFGCEFQPSSDGYFSRPAILPSRIVRPMSAREGGDACMSPMPE